MEYFIGNIESGNTGIYYKVKWESNDGSVWLCKEDQSQWVKIGTVGSKIEVLPFADKFLKSQDKCF